MRMSRRSVNLGRAARIAADDAPPGHPLRLPAAAQGPVVHPRGGRWRWGSGIGLNTTVFTFVNAVLIRGLPFDHPEQILYINSRNIVDRRRDAASRTWTSRTGAHRRRAFEGLAAYRTSDHERQRERAGRRSAFAGAMVSANTFGLLAAAAAPRPGFRARRGPAGAAPVVILGYAVWKNRYAGDPGILGRTIKVNDVACTVIGVMPEGMRFPINADMWRPFVPDRRRRDEARRPRRSACSAGSRPGATQRGRRRPSCTASPRRLRAAVPRHQQGRRRRGDDVQRAVQRRADPDGVPGADGRGRRSCC